MSTSIRYNCDEAKCKHKKEHTLKLRMLLSIIM